MQSGPDFTRFINTFMHSCIHISVTDNHSGESILVDGSLSRTI